MPVYVQTPNPEVLLTSGKNEVHSWLSKRDFGTIYTKQSKETKGWRAKQISINYCNSKGWFTRTTQEEAQNEAEAEAEAEAVRVNWDDGFMHTYFFLCFCFFFVVRVNQP